MEAGTLVVHPGALGDVLQAVPALRALRAAAPGQAITFAGQPRLGRLLVALGVVERARDFEGLGLAALFVEDAAPPALAEALGSFDRVVSWFGSRDETYGRRLRAVVPRAVVAPPVPDDDETPVWRHLIATLGAAASAATPEVEPIRLTHEALGSSPMLVVHPGSGGDWKRWPVERFAAVITALRERRALDVLVHQGPADAEAARGLMERLDGRAQMLLEPDLPQLAATLAAARAYLGGDSGVSHLAAAVGVPSVILFPAATRRHWTPWSPTAAPMELIGTDDDVGRVVRKLAGMLAAPTSR